VALRHQPHTSLRQQHTAQHQASTTTTPRLHRPSTANPNTANLSKQATDSKADTEVHHLPNSITALLHPDNIRRDNTPAAMVNTHPNLSSMAATVETRDTVSKPGMEDLEITSKAPTAGNNTVPPMACRRVFHKVCRRTMTSISTTNMEVDTTSTRLRHSISKATVKIKVMEDRRSLDGIRMMSCVLERVRL
jgi:hypothetical protein